MKSLKYWPYFTGIAFVSTLVSAFGFFIQAGHLLALAFWALGWIDARPAIYVLIFWLGSWAARKGFWSFSIRYTEKIMELILHLFPRGIKVGPMSIQQTSLRELTPEEKQADEEEEQAQKKMLELMEDGVRFRRLTFDHFRAQEGIETVRLIYPSWSMPAITFGQDPEAMKIGRKNPRSAQSPETPAG